MEAEALLVTSTEHQGTSVMVDVCAFGNFMALCRLLGLCGVTWEKHSDPKLWIGTG